MKEKKEGEELEYRVKRGKTVSKKKKHEKQKNDGNKFIPVEGMFCTTFLRIQEYSIYKIKSFSIKHVYL